MGLLRSELFERIPPTPRTRGCMDQVFMSSTRHSLGSLVMHGRGLILPRPEAELSALCAMLCAIITSARPLAELFLAALTGWLKAQTTGLKGVVEGAAPWLRGDVISGRWLWPPRCSQRCMALAPTAPRRRTLL